MADAPKNAGQSIVVENVVKGPVTTVDFGSILVTENWGRLFLAQGDKPPIVILGSAYPTLLAAIQHFSEPATPPASVVEAMEKALRHADQVSRDLGWHRIYNETGAALADLEAWRAGK